MVLKIFKKIEVGKKV